MNPGLHLNVAMRDYLALPAVSSSLLNTLATRCPRAAWHDSWLNPKRPLDDSGSAQDIGTVAHSLLLEGNADLIAPVDAPDWRTKAAQTARQAAREAGKVPLLLHQVEKVTAMCAAGRAYIDSLEREEPALYAALQPGGGDSEVVITWTERDGTPCKIRPDRISTDRRVLVNFKTTQATAEPATWFRRTALPMGYHMAAAFYERSVHQALGIEDAREVWLVQEQEAPYLCSLVALDEPGRDLARRRMMLALRTWSACNAAGHWHGYPARVAYAEMPAYEFMVDAEEAEVPQGIPYDYEKMGWTKPASVEH